MFAGNKRLYTLVAQAAGHGFVVRAFLFDHELAKLALVLRTDSALALFFQVARRCLKTRTFLDNDFIVGFSDKATISGNPIYRRSVDRTGTFTRLLARVYGHWENHPYKSAQNDFPKNHGIRPP
ncbi:MAG: hypothetical protein NDJ89_04405 [Oligoflexia bacterium]|nr:hypothetical protein [Oligoflexia bacterium]